MRISDHISAGEYAGRYIGQDITISGTVSSDLKILEKESSLTLEHVHLNYSTNALKSQAYVKLSGVKWRFERSDFVVFRGKAMPGFSDYDYYLWHPQMVS